MATKKKAETSVVKLTPVKSNRFSMTIQGISPLIQHAWSAKARAQMLAKKQGKKTKDRVACDPEQEVREASYIFKETEKGITYGIPVNALKSCLINAAHKDIGVEKTLVRKAVFIECPHPEGLIELQCSEPFMREDFVRLPGNSTDLRYRPQFDEWRATFEVTYDADLLSPEEILNLFSRAGFGVGLLEWRPERGGDFGRFEVV